MQPNMQQAGSKEWIGLAVLALPTLLVSMDMTILYLAAPSLSATLKPSGSELLWISDIYGFLVAGALIPMGAIGDRFGRRKLLLVGSLFFSIASVLAAFSINAAMLIGARALMGVAGATLLPSTLAMIRNMFHSPQQRSIAIGVWTTCFTLGGVAGPLIGGLLLEHFWWGSVFLIAVPVMAALMALGPVFLPEFREPSGHGIDLVSVAQSVTGVLAITFAVKQAAEHGITIAAATSALLGLSAITLFIRRQRRLAHPLIDLGLFSSPAFTAAIGANTTALFAWVGASFLVAQYFQLVLGMSPFAAGLWTIPPAIACVAGCLGAPALAQRVRSASVVSGALLLAAGGLALLSVAPATPGLAAIILGMMMLGLGVSTVVTLGTDLVLTAAPPEKAGAASAISETGADIGGSFGVAILGSIGVAIYQRSLVLPAGIDPAETAAARNTLGAAVHVAEKFPGSLGASLIDSAHDAFTLGLQVAAGAGAVVLFAMAVFFAWTSCRPFKTTDPQRNAMTRDSNESAIRTLIDDWSDAACKEDLERVVANRADDIVMFDVPEPVQARGIDAYRDTWKLFFASNSAGPDRFRISELMIVADDQVAFAHGLLTIGGGVAHCRLTIGMRKIGDRWRVVHEHHSMPIRLS